MFDRCSMFDVCVMIRGHKTMFREVQCGVGQWSLLRGGPPSVAGGQTCCEQVLRKSWDIVSGLNRAN